MELDEFDRGGMGLARQTDHSPLNGSRLSDHGVKAKNLLELVETILRAYRHVAMTRTAFLKFVIRHL